MPQLPCLCQNKYRLFSYFFRCRNERIIPTLSAQKVLNESRNNSQYFHDRRSLFREQVYLIEKHDGDDDDGDDDGDGDDDDGD